MEPRLAILCLVGGRAIGRHLSSRTGGYATLQCATLNVEAAQFVTADSFFCLSLWQLAVGPIVDRLAFLRWKLCQCVSKRQTEDVGHHTTILQVGLSLLRVGRPASRIASKCWCRALVDRHKMCDEFDVVLGKAWRPLKNAAFTHGPEVETLCAALVQQIWSADWYTSKVSKNLGRQTTSFKELWERGDQGIDHPHPTIVKLEVLPKFLRLCVRMISVRTCPYECPHHFQETSLAKLANLTLSTSFWRVPGREVC